MAENFKVTIGPVRFSYANVWKPYKNDKGEEKYMVNVIISKDDKKIVNQVKKTIAACAASDKGQQKLKGKKNWDNPLRDGDVKREGDGAYENCFYLNAKSDRQPGIVDSKTDPIIDPREFYSGCYGYVSITFYPYNEKGNVGIGVGLQNIMKTKDGEPLAGGATAKQDFKDIVIEEDDAEGIIRALNEEDFESEDDDGSEFF